MLCKSEYEALLFIRDHPGEEATFEGVSDETQRNLETDKFIGRSPTSTRGVDSVRSWYSLRITQRGLDALAEYENVQRSKKEIQKEKDRLRHDRRVNAFFRILTVFTFFVLILTNWNTISSFFSGTFAWIVSLLQ